MCNMKANKSIVLNALSSSFCKLFRIKKCCFKQIRLKKKWHNQLLLRNN